MSNFDMNYSLLNNIEIGVKAAEMLESLEKVCWEIRKRLPQDGDRHTDISFFSSASDFYRFEHEVDKHIYEFLGRFVDMRSYVKRLGGPEEIISDKANLPMPDRPLVEVYTTQDTVVASTPSLKIKEKWRNSNALDSVVARVLAATDIDPAPYHRRLKDGPLDYVIFNIYPLDTNPQFVLDPDNINVKTVGDLLLSKLGIDDNGLNISLHILTQLSDLIPPGTHHLISSKSSKTLDTAKWISMVSETRTSGKKWTF